MLNTVHHSGIEGYIIKNIKNQIDFALQVRGGAHFEIPTVNAVSEAAALFCPQPGNGNAWFKGVHLMPLVREVLSLPDGPETDLLLYLDRLATIRQVVFFRWLPW